MLKPALHGPRSCRYRTAVRPLSPSDTCGYIRQQSGHPWSASKSTTLPESASRLTKTPPIICSDSTNRRGTIVQTAVSPTGIPDMVIPSLQEWDIQFGSRIIEAYCGSMDDYVVLTSPSALRAVRDQFKHEPQSVAFITSQEQEENESLVRSLPRTKYVLGIGGDMALDAAKYVAWKLGGDLITIPTIISSGAIFQPSFPGRDHGRLQILPDIKVPLHVLIDTDVVRAAPPHLNAAGMAECICWLAQLASWRWWCDEGLEGAAWDQNAADEVENWVIDHVERYVSDLDADGRPGPDAIRASVMVNIERFDLKIWTLGAGHSIDHLLDNTFVYVHRKSLLHGEMVALGTMINNLLYGSCFDQARDMLRACGTRYRPDAIGCTWEQVHQTLQGVRENCDAIGWPETWFHYRDLDSDAFARIVNEIDS